MIAFLLTLMATGALCQLPQPLVPPIAAAGANPPLPPDGRGFRLQCSDQYVLMDQCDPELLRLFEKNAPPDYKVILVDPCVFPGKNDHRYYVRYQSNVLRQCEDIRRVRNDLNDYKPQNSNIGSIAVIPGGFLVEYKQFCLCYRRGYRRRRESDLADLSRDILSFVRQTASSFFVNPHPPTLDRAGNVARCDDRDFTCGDQNFWNKYF